MNERIQELAEQAHCYACEYAQRPDYNPHNPYNQSMYQQRYDSKFAELIVQECAQVSEDDITDGDACCTNTADRIARQIKKHFGVEE